MSHFVTGEQKYDEGNFCECRFGNLRLAFRLRVGRRRVGGKSDVARDGFDRGQSRALSERVRGLRVQDRQPGDDTVHPDWDAQQQGGCGGQNAGDRERHEPESPGDLYYLRKSNDLSVGRPWRGRSTFGVEHQRPPTPRATHFRFLRKRRAMADRSDSEARIGICVPPGPRPPAIAWPPPRKRGKSCSSRESDHNAPASL